MTLSDIADLAVAAAVIVPLVVAWIGHIYAAALKERERRATYIAMAIDILKQPPTPEARGLRRWASDLINHYSEVPMPDAVRSDLETAQVFQDFASHLQRMPEADRLREQERFTRQHIAEMKRLSPNHDLSTAAFKRALQGLGYFDGPITTASPTASLLRPHRSRAQPESSRRMDLRLDDLSGAAARHPALTAGHTSTVPASPASPRSRAGAIRIDPSWEARCISLRSPVRRWWSPSSTVSRATPPYCRRCATAACASPAGLPPGPGALPPSNPRPRDTDVDIEKRKQHNLYRDRHHVADEDVCRSLNKRHQPGLAHAASRSPSRSSRFITVETHQVW
jgi:hypothetical protein